MNVLSKEFIVQFWDLLLDLILQLINDMWAQQSMDPHIQQGIIKLIPKQTFCNKLSHWRPITMIKIFANAWPSD